MNVLVLVLVGF